MAGEGDSGGLPPGTVTFLFTDIEGSTQRWEAHRNLMPDRVARHNRLLTDAITGAGGRVVKRVDDGLMAVFPDAVQAVVAAIDGQRAVAAEDWSPVPPIRVRMGIHNGRATPADDDYLGDDVNRAARIADSGHGGQIVVSAAAAAMVEAAGVPLAALGRHQLKDLQRAVELFQVEADGLEHDFPPLRTLELAEHDLPQQRTSFVGRSAELAEIHATVRASRLTTVTGPGGVGKTRLSLHAAAEVASAFGDGVRFVELDAVDRPEDVAGALLDRLSASEMPTGADDPILVLVRHLRGKEMLLLLDNCEHQIDSCARVVDALLDTCPALAILATSRTPLGVPGERVVKVAPFRVSGQVSADDDAIRLFLERAHAKGAPIHLLASELESIADVCRMVDGLPLGIELAATRVPHLTPQGIGEHLARHTKLLDSRERTTHERHRSLDALLDWSYELLEPVERELFARLGVFAAPVTLEQIEQVVVGDGIERDDLLSILASLVDNSLLRADIESWPAHYSMLRLVHRFARQRIELQGRADDWLGRHAEWVLGCVGGDPDDVETDERLRAFMEHSDREYLAALGWAAETGRRKLAWRLIAAAWRWWEMRGRAREGLDLIDSIVDGSPPSDDLDRAAGLEGIANLAFIVGDLQRSLRCHQEAIEAFDRANQSVRAAWSRTGASMAQLLSGDPGARATAERALADFESAGSLRGIGHAKSSLGMIAARAGDHDEAERTYLDALSVLRVADQRRDAASVLSNLGNLAEDRGELRRATRFYDGALQLYREIGDRRGVALILNNLSIVAQRSGDPERARCIAEEARAIFQVIGDTAGEAACLTNLSNLAAARDDHQAALALCRESIEAFKRCADARGVVTGLRNAAALATGWGLDGMAWTWHVDAGALLVRLGMLAEARRELAALRELAGSNGLDDVAELVDKAGNDDVGSTLASLLDRLRDAGPADREPLPPPLPLDGFAELTGRQRELLLLVAEGLSNGEIAEQLFISQRTVDAHLSHIRAKLGITERAKLIVAARTALPELAPPR